MKTKWVKLVKFWLVILCIAFVALLPIYTGRTYKSLDEPVIGVQFTSTETADLLQLENDFGKGSVASVSSVQVPVKSKTQFSTAEGIAVTGTPVFTKDLAWVAGQQFGYNSGDSDGVYISTELASALFADKNATGNPLSIGKSSYVVKGVYQSKDRSFISTVNTKEQIYVPVQRIEIYTPLTTKSTLEIVSTLRDHFGVSSILVKPELTKTLIAQNSRVLLYVLLWIIFSLIGTSMLKTGIKLTTKLKELAGTYYLHEIILKKSKNLVKDIAVLIMKGLLCVCLIVIFIKKPIFPSEWLPSNPVSLLEWIQQSQYNLLLFSWVFKSGVASVLTKAELLVRFQLIALLIIIPNLPKYLKVTKTTYIK